VPSVENISRLIGETGWLEIVLLKSEVKSGLNIGDILPLDRRASVIATRSDFDLEHISVHEGVPEGRAQFALPILPTAQRHIGELLSKNRGELIAITVSGRIRHIVKIGDSFSSGSAGVLTIEDASGGLAVTEAREYERLFRWDSLPLLLRQEETEIVSPSMGDDQLKAALAALIGGIALVMCLMLLLYGTYLGIVGCVALTYCILLSYGVFSATGLVLTLSSLAGFVLTAGVAVDSFILIFEGIKDNIRDRMRNKLIPFDEDYIWQEIRQTGRHLMALRITTIVGAAALLLSSGHVRGFAVSLIVGLTCEAIVASRLVLGGLLLLIADHGKKVSRWTYGIPLLQGNWIRAAFARVLSRLPSVTFVSILLGIVCGIWIFLKPPPLGLDFAGGLQVRVELPNARSREWIHDSLRSTPLGTALAAVQGIPLQHDKENRSWILSFRRRGIPSDDSQAVQMLQSALSSGGTHCSISGTWNTGPRLPSIELRRWLFTALAASLLILVYCATPLSGISLGGERLRPATVALLTVWWDLLIVIGLLSVFQLEVNANVVVGLFFLLGYSINDTLVLTWHLDREVRSVIRSDEPLPSVERVALNIRDRTFNTSLTSFLAVLPVALLASTEYRSYMFVVTVGICVGTYSSTFIAGFFLQRIINRLSRRRGLIAVESSPRI